MTLRVLHVVRPAAGGIRQHVLELLRRTDAARFSPSIAAPSEFLAGLPPNLLEPDRLMVDIAPRLSPGRDVLAAARIAQYIHAQSDILLHAHGLRAAFVSALAHRLRPFPFVFTAHNLVNGRRLTRLGIRFAGNQATQVIAVSQAVAEGLAASGIPAHKIKVIPNGVDLERFAPRSLMPPPPPILGEPGRDFTVGCVARLSREKGVDVLVQAAARMPEVRFLMAGDGPERATLTASAPPNVRWLGRVADTRDVYGASDVIAVPSRQEGQGLVALEAMASGVPVVASRVGGLAEMLTDGETALLVPPDSPTALASALTRLRDDPGLRDLARVGRMLVQTRYDIRQMIAGVEATYAAIIGGR